MRDDRNALHRRTVSARMNGIYATFVGFKMVKLPIWMYTYAVKNAVVEMVKIIIPDWLYDYLHKKGCILSSRGICNEKNIIFDT